VEPPLVPPTVVIPEEKPPLIDIPKTGNNSNIGWMWLLFCLSMAGICGIVVLDRHWKKHPARVK
jgi:hypothetical protein